MCGSDVQALLGLAHCLCDDLATMFPHLRKGLERDKKYISRRVASEGISFLTKVLPNFGKDFDEWLKNEDLTEEIGSNPRNPDKQVSDLSDKPSTFSEYLTPKFIMGVKDLIRNDGTSESDRATIYRWVRQLAYTFYKLEVPFTKEQLDETYCKFASDDLSLSESDGRISQFETGEAAELIGKIMGSFKARPLFPKHGPGSVATGEVGEEKWCFKRKFRSLHRQFPMYDYFVPTPHVWRADTGYVLDWYKSLECVDYPEARVVAVPKDSRGPRLISEEPLELQFMQQAYLRLLVPHLERHPLTKGFVNFTDQRINQRIALQSSKTKEFSTIDLADASDMVSDYLVYLLFGDSIYRDLRALRSRTTVLPNGTRVRLNKFAPMGSSICFPIEALTFWSVCKAAIRKATKGSDGEVYVYGDDIIVPTEYCLIVCKELESVGLRVNWRKTYYTGSFRESCGVDAWKGYNITPHRLRHRPPSRQTDVTRLANWIAVSNSLRKDCFCLSADYIFNVVSRVASVPWNIQGTELSFHDSIASFETLRDLNQDFRFRFNPENCQQECFCPAVRQKAKLSTLGGWPRLHRNLLMMPRDPSHWQPRRVVSVKHRWTSVNRSLPERGAQQDGKEEV